MNTQINVGKNPKKVRLLGKGEGWEKAPDNDQFELWGLNGLIYANKKLDRVFILDVIDEMPSVVSGLWELQPTIDRINEMNIPLVAPYKYDEIPLSEAFPIDEAIREFGQPYFNNTIAFMICYALLKGVDELEIYGINQASGTEYFYEKGCVEYWLGIATGMGVKVSVHGQHCELLSNKQRYGGNRLYGYNMSYEDFFKLRERFGGLAVKKLLAPKAGKLAYMGPEKSKSLRTSDTIGIKKLWQIFAGHPEGKWVVSLNDAFNLARFVIESAPKRILDLGTGIGLSSAVLKKTAPEAEVVTIEQFPKCIQIARDLMQSSGINGVDFRHSNIEKFEVPGISNHTLIGYKELPEGKWDMVVIDGPGPEKLPDGTIFDSATMACGDIFRLVGSINPGGLVYVDGRDVTVHLIRRFLGKYFRPSFGGGASGFTVFERTEQVYDPSGVEDGLLEGLKIDKYL